MVACVFARGCARVLACVLAIGVGSASAQEIAPANEPVPAETSAQPEQPVTSGEASAATAEPTNAKPVKGASPLPDLVVDAPTAPAPKTSKKSTGNSSASAPAVSNEATEPEVPGVVYGQALSDTGTTTFDASNVKLRTSGGGDANSFLRNLPNVQYQDDSSTNAGVDGQSLIDTRPLLLSISGARSYENNFIVNGVSTKNITGTIERTTTPLSDTTLTPSMDSIFGLHPQQLYVPAEFLSQAAVIDSNASAEYGEFLGGVVIYDLAAPPTDRYRASIDYSRHTDKMVNYIIATPDGKNLNAREHPTFTKNNLAVSIGAPITTDMAFIIQASRKTAESQKQKDYTLYSGYVVEDSTNNFFRGAVSLKTEIGKFTFDSSLTDYSQYWESYAYRDLSITVEGQTSSTQLSYKADVPGVEVGYLGVDGVKFESRAYFNSSESTNLSPGDTVWNWVGARRSRNTTTGVWTETFRTSVLSDWCRPVPLETLPNSGSSANMVCREGGYADMLQGQEDIGLTAKTTGNFLFGRFNIGGEIKSVEGHRARLEDYTLYGVSTIVPTAGNPFDCPEGEEAEGCNSEQFTSSRNIAPAFDAKATVNAAHAYSEVDQTLGWFNVRAGVRLDYEDYFKNLNLAPRLAGTVTPFSGFSVTGGYNRYYEGESLYYALRDQQPRAVPAYSRSIIDDGTTRTLKPWSTTQSGGVYTYIDDGAETPFTDEYTGAMRIQDPFLGGNLRLRYLERYYKKGYSSADCPGVSNCIQLVNEAEKFYRSATAEYTKEWRTLDTRYLSAAGITGNITWSEQSASAARNNYHDDLEDLDNNGTPDYPILYGGQSYNRRDFDAVTGNLDIPIRVGATLSTNWFNNIFLLDVSAGYNLGYQGVYDTERTELFTRPNETVAVLHDVFEDKKFSATLKVDVMGQINVTEQAAIEFEINNITNSPGNAVATYTNPWVIGRSYWVGSKLRF